MGIFFSVAERKGRNKQPRMPIFLPEFQPYVAVSFKFICKDFLVSMIFGHFVFHAIAKSHTYVFVSKFFTYILKRTNPQPKENV